MVPSDLAPSRAPAPTAGCRCAMGGECQRYWGEGEAVVGSGQPIGHLCCKALPIAAVSSQPLQGDGLQQGIHAPEVVMPTAWLIDRDGPRLDGSGCQAKERARPCWRNCFSTWMRRVRPRSSPLDGSLRIILADDGAHIHAEAVFRSGRRPVSCPAPGRGGGSVIGQRDWSCGLQSEADAGRRRL